MSSSTEIENTTAPVTAEASIGFGAVAEAKKKHNKKPYPKKGANNSKPKEAVEGEDATPASTDDAAKALAKAKAKKLNEKKKQNSNPNEPYIFIIKNAENDLCRIHESALPQFLGLNVMNQEKRRDGASYYETKIRSETRTGELTFHGYDEAAFFRSATSKPAGKVHINKLAGQKRERAEETTESKAESTAAEGEAAIEPEARFNTIADMLAYSSNHSYYNSHLTFNHTSGKGAANSLMGKLSGAVAEVNQKLTPKGLRKVLKDVPGFLSCWFLKATGPTTTHFRVVFNTEAELLSAKEMLDQFEADQGVRVSIKLSDNLASKFQKYLLEKASGGAPSDDVVAINTHNEDYE